VKPNTIQRIALFQYDPESGTVEMRHYFVTVKAVGLSKTVKKLLEGRVPSKLGSLESIDQVLDREGAWSDTDGEGEEVPLAAPVRALRGRGRVRLVEIGPRMTLKLMKVEAGFAGGETLYHEHEVRSREEAAEAARRVRAKHLEKQRRKREQDANVERKETVKREKKEAKEKRREERQQERANGAASDDSDEAEGDSDDDGAQPRRRGGLEVVPAGAGRRRGRDESEEDDGDDDYATGGGYGMDDASDEDDE
jgi:ribosome biogenesis protein SSF1/2